MSSHFLRVALGLSLVFCTFQHTFAQSVSAAREVPAARYLCQKPSALRCRLRLLGHSIRSLISAVVSGLVGAVSQ
jgi:hypothetical protein